MTDELLIKVIKDLTQIYKDSSRFEDMMLRALEEAERRGILYMLGEE